MHAIDDSSAYWIPGMAHLGGTDLFEEVGPWGPLLVENNKN